MAAAAGFFWEVERTMTVLHVLFLSSAVSWLLLIGLAVSVVRIEKLVLGMRTGQEPQDDGPALGSVAPEFADPEPIRPVNLGRADAMRGVPQLYWFMRTNCAPCLHLRPLVEAIASEYEGSPKTGVAERHSQCLM